MIHKNQTTEFPPGCKL